jgi:K+-transporting ATPase, c chain
MLKELRPAIVVLLALTLITGIIYPLAMTGIAQLVFPYQANGSLLRDKDGKVIGSELIGQNFTSPKYFQGRPSVTTGTDARATALPSPITRPIPTPRIWAHLQGAVDRVTADTAKLKAENPASRCRSI